MRQKKVCAVFLALVMLMCGCADNTSSLPESDPVSGRVMTSESGEPAEKEKAKPYEDMLYMSNYVPPAEETAVNAGTITGTVGETDTVLIPSVFITCGEDIGRTAYSECTVQIDASMTEGYAGTGALNAKIRGRGHSTWNWPKKPYKIKLEEKAPILGMTPSKEWALIANYADESLMRNLVAFDMAASMGTFTFTPRAVPVNVYLNGVYQGVYTIGEQIEAKESRLRLDYREDTPNTGYLLEVGGADHDTDIKGLQYFDLPSGCAADIAIKSPKDEKLTQENYDYIYKYMCLADEAITTLDGYETYIDVDSFIDWFLLHELTYNLDSCFHRSCFITKDRGGKLKMGPVWDFDLAFGNMYMDNPDYDDWATVGNSNSTSYIGVNWFNYLMADPSFRERARSRWDEIKDKLVAAGQDSIDSWQKLITPSAELNFTIWNTLGSASGFQPLCMKSVSTYNEQVAYLRRFITKRAAWIDENL